MSVQDHIIKINFESLEGLAITNMRELLDELRKRTRDLQGKLYFFFDEIKQFEVSQ